MRGPPSDLVRGRGQWQPVHSAECICSRGFPTMQLTNEPTAAQFPAIIAAMHDDRIDRYMPAAGGSKEDAFRLYLWNGALCEAFYLPLHIAEISVRNAIHTRLSTRLGEQWYDNKTLKNVMGERQLRDMEDAVREERHRHGVLMNRHHLVSSLSFGFWQHLLTNRFHRLLWPRGMLDAFPNLPNQFERHDVHDRVEIIRKWRNRIAHHKAIFDEGPTRKHQETIQLVRWVCHDVADWLTAASKVPIAVALRPVRAA